MARKPRQEIAGGVHHVYARGNDRCAVYRDDADRQAYLALLGTVVVSRGWRCLAYCQMTNHVHLLLETPRANLGRGMHQLHGEYARRFNKRHGRSGHLFGGRFGSVHVGGDAQLWAAAAYVAVNPVDAGLCRRPEDWPWSSHGATLGEADRPPWLDVSRLLWHFSAGRGDPQGRYATYVADRLARRPG
jgi:REP element-mobilizing transposase RayT